MADFVPNPQDYASTADPKPQTRVSPRAALLIGSAVVLEIVLQITQGFSSLLGIGLLSVSLIACAIAAAGPHWLDQPFTITTSPQANRIARWLFAILVVAQLAIGIRKIVSVPRPNIDVWVFHADSARALHRGINPYTISFPNIYYPDVWVYAPEVVRGDRLTFGYPYPPLTLLLSSAGHLLLGDCRGAMLLAMTLTSILIALMRPDWIGILIATLTLLMPSFPFVLEMGWTEPFQTMLLAGLVLCTMRAPIFTGVMLGLLIASKQYAPAILSLLPLIHYPNSRWRARGMVEGHGPGLDLVIAIVVATVITLPFALWDMESFVHSVVTLQWHQPFRKDALSFLNLWRAGREGWIGPSWVSFAAMGIAIVLCYWRRAAFALAVAFTFFMFFAFNKQAFANYYYLVVAALCIAAASERLNASPGSTDKS